MRKVELFGGAEADRIDLRLANRPLDPLGDEMIQTQISHG